MNFRRYANARSWLVAAPLLFVLAACSMPTPYQPANGGYGYKEQQLEANRYRVSFDGNASTDRDDVQNYLLYRAAELTVQKDFDYFTIVDRDLDRSTRYYNQGFVNDFGFRRFRGRRNNRRFFGPRFVSSSSYPVDEYSSTADIVMGKGEKPVEDAQAYDALDVLQQLQPSIRLPGENEE
ncbi:MAG: CC0125/CC1285 family lipoprotein [Geminicoccales bacterium]